MSLSISKVELVDFRSYSRYVLEPSETLTIIVGPNAVGKTNIIEAVQLVTAGDSFRHPRWGDCIRWGQQAAAVSMQAVGGGRVADVRLTIRDSGRRTYSVNGKTVRRLHEVAGVLPCVVFTPEDLGIVKDSAEKRRTTLDGVGEQLSATYGAMRAEYDRIVRQRNAILRAPELDQGGLDAWTLRLISVGAAFTEHRTRLFRRLAPRVSEAYATLSGGETLALEYSSQWAGNEPGGITAVALEERMRESLDMQSREELARGTTLAGPHRDDVAFKVGDRDARTFASQGQQRTIALAWKLAELGVIEEVGGQPPTLLLDDVMSELDESRRNALATLVRESAQTIMTTTNLGYFDAELVGRAKVVELR